MLEDFTFEAPKTKEFLSVLKNLKIEGKKVLFVLPESNKNGIFSARNLQRAEVILASRQFVQNFERRCCSDYRKVA